MPDTTSENEKPPIVEFRNVTKTFDAGTDRAFTAVKDVTFKVEDAKGVAFGNGF